MRAPTPVINAKTNATAKKNTTSRARSPVALPISATTIAPPMYAPYMTKDPCAKFNTPISPKINDNPAAIIVYNAAFESPSTITRAKAPGSSKSPKTVVRSVAATTAVVTAPTSPTDRGVVLPVDSCCQQVILDRWIVTRCRCTVSRGDDLAVVE